MINPSYTKGIPNAVSSIAKFLGDNSMMEYATHQELDIYLDKGKYDKVVFLLIDGLGYNYIKRRGSGYIYDHMIGHLSSTFPSTTSVAHTARNTGMAAYNHGMTSRYMYLKELGLHIKSIPFMSCLGNQKLTEHDVDPELLFNVPSIFTYFPTKTASVLPQQYAGDPYNVALFEQGNMAFWYDDSTMDDIFTKIQESEKNNTYTYAYYHQFDTDSHNYGNASIEVADLYTQLEQKIQTLRSNLDERTCLMISSDHGFMDQSDDKNLLLGDEVLTYLTTPPYGERRYVYFDVDHRYEKEFLKYMSGMTGGSGELKKSQGLLDSGFFGTGTMHAKVADRIGTYTLLMHDGWVCTYPVPGRKHSSKIGHHGGLSEDEMLCPIVICE